MFHLNTAIGAAVAVCLWSTATFVYAQAATELEAPVQKNLYAVEIKTGPAWDASKATHEQIHFREHSANLKNLRDQGKLVLGARYGDRGLIVVESPTEAEARAMFDQDPSIAAKVFAYTLFDFNVFYGGSVAPKKRKP
jgi:uncharacterized protein YciI